MNTTHTDRRATLADPNCSCSGNCANCRRNRRAMVSPGLSDCGCSAKRYDGLMDGPKVPPEEVKRIIREESEAALRSVNIVALATSSDPVAQLTGVVTSAVEKSVERVCTTGVEATIKDNWMIFAGGAAALVALGYVIGK